MLLCIVRKRGNQPNSLFQKLGLLPLSFERPGLAEPGSDDQKNALGAH